MPKYFLIIATVSNIFKLTGLSCNAISRITILEHYSKNNNIVDVSNKGGIQHNIALLTGNLLGFGISMIIPMNNFALTFSLLSLLSVLKISLGYKGTRKINFDEFNFQRTCLVTEEYINSKTILSPLETSAKEKLLFRRYSKLYFCTHSPEMILKLDNNPYVLKLFDIFKDKSYFILIFPSHTRYRIYSFLKVNAENNDIFISFLLSIKIYSLLKQNKQKNLTYDDLASLIASSIAYVDCIDKKTLFEKMKLVGWSLNFTHLEQEYSRLHMLFKKN